MYTSNLVFDEPDMCIHDPTSHLKMVLHAAATMRPWYNRSSLDLNMASYQKCVSAMGREGGGGGVEGWRWKGGHDTFHRLYHGWSSKWLNYF